MINARGVICASLAYSLGIYSLGVENVHGKSALLPNCGQELCVKGYEICIESRCRQCADFEGTQYGCQNKDTQRDCSSFCIDEAIRDSNVTIQLLKNKISLRYSHGSEDSQFALGVIILIAILVFLVGLGGGVGGTLIVRRYKSRKDQSNTSSEESLDPRDMNRNASDFRDSRLSQIPPRDESQGLIAQETTVLE